MNGAESLVRTLLACEVDVCFTNPGTSEMHFVAALDRVPGMRCVLGLFEGVVTGAADGYARMADRPASTLLHLGPGLTNGMANLHNARKARTPIVNIVGEHASDHLRHESPLRSDVPGAAALCSDWYRVSSSGRAVAGDAAEAVAQARSGDGRIATLILPADTAWGEADGPAVPRAPQPRPQVAATAIAAAVQAIRSGKRCVLVLSGNALREPGLTLAGRIAAKTGVKLFSQGAVRRIERGLGRLPITRMPFAIDQGLALLADVEVLILIGAPPPAAFFGYPGKPRLLAPAHCETQTLAEPHDDVVQALQWLADELGAAQHAPLVNQAPRALAPADGPLTADSLMQALAAGLPEHSILCDESVSAGRTLFRFTDGAAPHDYLQITGGSIGLGLPMATGAAVACPDRKVICLEGDGSGMYTLQALWTQAREQLDVVNIVLANRGYQILRGELKNVGIEQPGERAQRMLDIVDPRLDWVSLAKGQGVEAVAVDTTAGFSAALAAATARRGPFLIEARIG
ncbi:MAG: acetolactate synthase large subunit [Burkholderiales bacterium]|nr:acetolactate synthase large subunit [Burkholderiales bacterium]